MFFFFSDLIVTSFGIDDDVMTTLILLQELMRDGKLTDIFNYYYEQ